MVGTGRFELPTPHTASERFSFVYCFRYALKLVVVCLIVRVYIGLRQTRI
jgi:hypothetical protein